MNVGEQTGLSQEKEQKIDDESMNEKIIQEMWNDKSNSIVRDQLLTALASSSGKPESEARNIVNTRLNGLIDDGIVIKFSDNNNLISLDNDVKRMLDNGIPYQEMMGKIKNQNREIINKVKNK